MVIANCRSEGLRFLKAALCASQMCLPLVSLTRVAHFCLSFVVILTLILLSLFPVQVFSRSTKGYVYALSGTPELWSHVVPNRTQIVQVRSLPRHIVTTSGALNHTWYVLCCGFQETRRRALWENRESGPKDKWHSSAHPVSQQRLLPPKADLSYSNSRLVATTVPCPFGPFLDCLIV